MYFKNINISKIIVSYFFITKNLKLSIKYILIKNTVRVSEIDTFSSYSTYYLFVSSNYYSTGQHGTEIQVVVCIRIRSKFLKNDIKEQPLFF